MFTNLIGQRFGRLLVKEMTDKRTSHRNIIYLCLCDCGNQCLSGSGNLRSGHKQSCGCIKKELDRKKGKSKKLDDYPSSFNRMFRGYRRNAELRNLPFELSKDEFMFLTSSSCFYCGVEPKYELKDKNLDNVYIYNGIDRVDNLMGYTKSNCVPCCFICNRAKMNMSYQDFIDWTYRVFYNLQRK